ncbi:BI1-like protein [Carex littledalei]|uniref:BI1-like protein n=1 Tax=Carex littledalei TaxID=544730 RepID=A0A833QXT0_9POAL|nr:BI1-like protein [Carex littledalei]
MGNQPQKLLGEESAVTKPLYPAMVESPELRWALIRKIYSILIVQILLTIVIASVAVFVPLVTAFFSTTPGLVLCIVLIIFPFIVLWPLHHYYQRYPVNFILLGLFTVAISFAVGSTCAITSGKVILEAVILTAVLVRGYGFGFLRPFLSASLMALIVFGLIQVFFPFGKITSTIYGGIAALLFCAYIVDDTDDLIKRYSYDEYIRASAAIYLDIFNLFVKLLNLFRAFDR